MGMLKLRARGDHRFSAANLSAYLDGRLSEHDRERVEHHLAQCVDCRRDLATLSVTVRLMRQAPLRSIPRSFALPVSVRDEQARYRRWNTAYGLVRGAAVAVSFALVVLLSSDALIGMGVLPMLGRVAPVTDREAEMAVVRATVVVEKAVERAAVEEQRVPQAEGLGGGGPAPLPTLERAKEKREAEVPVPEAASPSAPLLVEKVVRTAKGAAPATEGVAPPRVLGAEPGVARDEGGETGEAPMRALGTLPLPAAEAVPPTMTAAPTTMPPMAQPSATPPPSRTQMLSPTPLPSRTPPPTATAAKVAVLVLRETPTRVRPPEAPVPETVRAVWEVWHIVRVVSGMLVGTLLLLLGGLVWVGHKRRV